jgi:hypothetical protein
MPRVGFEPTTPVFEQAKTVHAVDRAAAVIGSKGSNCAKIYKSESYITANICRLHFQK